MQNNDCSVTKFMWQKVIKQHLQTLNQSVFIETISDFKTLYNKLVMISIIYLLKEFQILIYSMKYWYVKYVQNNYVIPNSSQWHIELF